MDIEELKAIIKELGINGPLAAGDFVLEKNVEYEIDNVEAGGIGIQIINGNTANTNTPATETPEIHTDIDTPASEDSCEPEPGNPTINREPARERLKEVLTDDRIDSLLSDSRYTVGWRNTFVDSLMASEHGEEIARNWAKEDKHNKIMAHVIGTLADAGVFTGTYNAISKKVDIMRNYRSFSKYMSGGKQQPYALWVKQYVAHNGYKQ